MENLVLTQLTASGLVVWLMQKLKGAKSVPQVSQSTDGLNRVLAVILATAAAAGIGYGYTWEAGTFTFSVTGLTVTAVLGFGWKVVTGLATQEIIYRAAVKPNDK